MVSTLIQIKDEKPDAKLKVMVGIAFSPTDGKAPVYDYWMGMLGFFFLSIYLFIYLFIFLFLVFFLDFFLLSYFLSSSFISLSFSVECRLVFNLSGDQQVSGRVCE
jgi:hypothetical protein